MPAPRLKAVGPHDVPPARRRPMTIIEAVDAGDRLAELVATHRRIAKAVQDDATPARDLAALSRRQMEISKEIEVLKRQADEEAAENAVSEDEDWSEAAI